MQTKMKFPVGPGTVNGNTVRATALLVFVVTGGYFFIHHWSIAGFFAVDFFLHGFNQGDYSLLKNGGKFFGEAMAAAG